MFTVVIPLYNKASTILNTVQSVLSQDFCDFEIVIVDDGSSDGGGDIVDGLKDSRIKVLHQQNRGVSVARNEGIKAAKYPFICFLDADDRWLSNHLSVLYELIKTYPGLGLYSTTFKLIDENGVVEERFDDRLPVIIHDYIGYLCKNKTLINTNTVCIPKSTFETVGYFTEGEKISEDISLWMRAALCYDIGIVQVPTAEYHRENSTASAVVYYNSNWKFPMLAKNLISESNIDPVKQKSLYKYLARYQTGVCILQCRLGQKKAAIRTFKQLDFKNVQKSRLLKCLIAIICPYIIYEHN